MCLQCFAAAKLIKQNVLPGFSLMQSQEDAPGWPKGHFGLVQVNDPMVVFAGPLLVDPFKGEDEDSAEWMPEKPDGCDGFQEAAQALEQALKLDAVSGYRLVRACIESGYKPKSDGLLGYWLLDFLATECPNLAASAEAPSNKNNA